MNEMSDMFFLDNNGDKFKVPCYVQDVSFADCQSESNDRSYSLIDAFTLSIEFELPKQTSRKMLKIAKHAVNVARRAERSKRRGKEKLRRDIIKGKRVKF